jgi:hypothetical protein
LLVRLELGFASSEHLVEQFNGGLRVGSSAQPPELVAVELAIDGPRRAGASGRGGDDGTCEVERRALTVAVVARSRVGRYVEAAPAAAMDSET